MTPEALEKKAAEYEAEAQVHLANFHRLSGAALALREMAKATREQPKDEGQDG